MDDPNSDEIKTEALKIGHEKLRKVISELGVVQKTGINPHFRSEYVKLSALINVLGPLLDTHELLVNHKIRKDGMFTTIKYEGELIDFSQVEMVEKAAQKKGSEITYFKRYNLMALFNVSDEDDDGNATTDNAEPDDSPASVKQKEFIKTLLTQVYENVTKEMLVAVDTLSKSVAKSKINDLLKKKEDLAKNN